MKKSFFGLLFVLAVLSAWPASAQSPCWGVCQAYYPCDYPCDLCEGDPGLWEGSHCWGTIVPATCGDIGQCGYVPCEPQWTYSQWAAYQGVTPVFQFEPCEWVVVNGQWVEVCDWQNPYKCSVNPVYRFVRHQTNCEYQPSSQTFCEVDGFGRYIGRYGGYWDSACCWDANQYDCYTYFPQC